MTRTRARAALLAASSSCALLALASPLSARQVNPGTISRGTVTIDAVACERVVDPKLAGAQITFSYSLAPANVPIEVTARIEKNGAAVAVPFAGVETSTGAPLSHTWNGKSAAGTWLDCGEYVLRLTAKRGKHVAIHTTPISIVRLGVASMAAVPSAGANEWPLVYYKQGATYTFFVTPPIHEYANLAETGEPSDLDLSDGAPRAAVAVHSSLSDPVLESNGEIEDATYNYPLCYLAAANPRLDVVLGASATKANGAAQACGYPIAGLDVRCVLSDDVGGAWTHSTDVTQPGQTVTFDGPALPARGTRQDRVLTFRWQHRPIGGGTWSDVPGSLAIALRFYTLVAPPAFAIGATGAQYAGPWVEVCEQFHGWSQALAIDAVDANAAIAIVVKGMFGQQPGLPAAIEGVKYDCPSVGGDGGANHYYLQSQQTIQLAKLLNGHANGVYVNCSDCASTTAAVAGMLGVATVKMMRLGPMQLKAIWGIGCPAYTLNLWGGGNHGFSYHHVVTRDDGASVVDDCLCVDEDGFPLALPGTPGWNIDRIWINGSTGYMELLAKGTVSRSVEILPKLK